MSSNQDSEGREESDIELQPSTPITCSSKSGRSATSISRKGTICVAFGALLVVAILLGVSGIGKAVANAAIQEGRNKIDRNSNSPPEQANNSALARALELSSPYLLSTSYQVNWVNYGSCSRSSRVATITCPYSIAAHSVNGGASSCEVLDDKTIACRGISGSIDVLCLGRTVSELLVEIDLEGSEHNCEEKDRVNWEAGSQSGGGQAKLSTTILSGYGKAELPLSCEKKLTNINNERLEACSTSKECKKWCSFDPLLHNGYTPSQCKDLSCEVELEPMNYKVTQLTHEYIGGYNLPNGSVCSHNYECLAECSFGVCQDPLPDLALCEESNDCFNKICAYKDASYAEQICCPEGQSSISSSGEEVCLGLAENGAECDGKDSICQSNDCGYVDFDEQVHVCCGNGSFSHQACSFDFLCEPQKFCLAEAPVGANCDENYNDVCQADVCVAGQCKAGKQQAGEICDDDLDCQSGTCAFVEYTKYARDGIRSCCAGTETFTHKASGLGDNNEYCAKQAPSGASCGENINDLCQSNVCVDGKCEVGKVSVNEVCDDNDDCQSDVCANGQCKDGKLSTSEVCDEDEDCESATCAFVELTKNQKDGTLKCCSGTETFVTVYQLGNRNEYCSNSFPPGATCLDHMGQVMCQSKICENGLCTGDGVGEPPVEAPSASQSAEAEEEEPTEIESSGGGAENTEEFSLYSRTGAIDVAMQSGVSIGTSNVGYIDAGDWMTYSDIWFGSAGETARIRVRFAKGNTGGMVEVRLGDRNGRLIGTFTPWNTGGWSNFEEGSFEIDNTVEGLHALTFVGLVSNGIMVFNWFELAPPIDTIKLVTMPPFSPMTRMPTLKPTAGSTDGDPTLIGPVPSSGGEVLSDDGDEEGAKEEGSSAITMAPPSPEPEAPTTEPSGAVRLGGLAWAVATLLLPALIKTLP